MLRQKTAARVGRFLVGGALLIAMAGPAMAGTVYSWVTDDGTYAFTDDPKRIPAKHKDTATARPMGSLSRYERYTVDGTGSSHAERIQQRQAELRDREASAPQVTAAGGGNQGSGLVYNMPFNVGRSGGGQRGAGMQLPLAGSGPAQANSNDPVVVESIRVKPEEGQASRHWTVVKQGDRIISVFKGENRDRSSEPVSESDFGL